MILAFRSPIVCIQFVKRERAPVTQPRQHEPLDDLHRRFIALGFFGRGQDRSAVMLGQFQVVAINASAHSSR